MFSKIPLHNYPVLRADSDRDLEDYISLKHGGKILRLPPRQISNTRTGVNWIELPNSQLGFSRYGREITFELPEIDFVRVKMVTTGTLTVQTGQGISTIQEHSGSISTGPVTITCSPDAEIVSFLVARPFLLDKIQALRETDNLVTVDFPATISLLTLAGLNFRNTLQSMFSALEQAAPKSNTRLFSNLENALVTALVIAAPPEVRADGMKLPNTVIPRAVRRVEAYLSEHWRDNPDVEELATVAGMSSRNLFRLFKLYRGYSPHAFGKRLRLEYAMKYLADPETGARIVEIALECGWNSPAHFSKDFREAFGVTPSQLRRNAIS